MNWVDLHSEQIGVCCFALAAGIALSLALYCWLRKSGRVI